MLTPRTDRRTSPLDLSIKATTYYLLFATFSTLAAAAVTLWLAEQVWNLQSRRYEKSRLESDLDDVLSKAGYF